MTVIRRMEDPNVSPLHPPRVVSMTPPEAALAVGGTPPAQYGETFEARLPYGGAKYHTSMGGTGWTPAVAVSPLDPDMIVMGGDTAGVTVSHDGGRTVFTPTGCTMAYVLDICCSRFDRNRIYVVGEGGLFISNDAGKTFTKVWHPAFALGAVPSATVGSSTVYRTDDNFYQNIFLRVVETRENEIYLATGHNRYSQTVRLYNTSGVNAVRFHKASNYKQEGYLWNGTVWRMWWDGTAWQAAIVLTLAGCPDHPYYRAQVHPDRTLDELMRSCDYDGIYQSGYTTRFRLHEQLRFQRDWMHHHGGLRIWGMDAFVDEDGTHYVAVSASTSDHDVLWRVNGHNPFGDTNWMGRGFLHANEWQNSRLTRMRQVGGLFVGKRLTNSNEWNWDWYSRRDVHTFQKNLGSGFARSNTQAVYHYEDPMVREAHLQFKTYETTVSCRSWGLSQLTLGDYASSASLINFSQMNNLPEENYWYPFRITSGAVNIVNAGAHPPFLTPDRVQQSPLRLFASSSTNDVSATYEYRVSGSGSWSSVGSAIPLNGSQDLTTLLRTSPNVSSSGRSLEYSLRLEFLGASTVLLRYESDEVEVGHPVLVLMGTDVPATVSVNGVSRSFQANQIYAFPTVLGDNKEVTISSTVALSVRVYGVLLMPSRAVPQGMTRVAQSEVVYSPANFASLMNETNKWPHQRWWFHNMVSWVQFQKHGNDWYLYWSQVQRLPSAEHYQRFYEPPSNQNDNNYTRFCVSSRGTIGYTNEDDSGNDTYFSLLPYCWIPKLRYVDNEASISGSNEPIKSVLGYQAGLYRMRLNQPLTTERFASTLWYVNLPTPVDVHLPDSDRERTNQNAQTNLQNALNAILTTKPVSSSVNPSDTNFREWVGFPGFQYYNMLNGHAILKFWVHPDGDKYGAVSLPYVWGGRYSDGSAVVGFRTMRGANDPYRIDHWSYFPVKMPSRGKRYSDLLGVIGATYNGQNAIVLLGELDKRFDNGVSFASWIYRTIAVSDYRESLSFTLQAGACSADGQWYYFPEVWNYSRWLAFWKRGIGLARTDYNPATLTRGGTRYHPYGLPVNQEVRNRLGTDPDDAYAPLVYFGQPADPNVTKDDFYRSVFELDRIQDADQLREAERDLLDLAPFRGIGGFPNRDSMANTGHRSNGGYFLARDREGRLYFGSGDPGIRCFRERDGQLVREWDYERFLQEGAFLSVVARTKREGMNSPRHGLAVAVNPNDSSEAIFLFIDLTVGDNPASNVFLPNSSSLRASYSKGWHGNLYFAFRDRWSFPLTHDWAGYCKPEPFRRMGWHYWAQPMDLIATQWQPHLVFYMVVRGILESPTFNATSSAAIYNYTTNYSTWQSHVRYNQDYGMEPFPDAPYTGLDWRRTVQRWYSRNMVSAVYRVTVKRDSTTGRLRWAHEWAMDDTLMRQFLDRNRYRADDLLFFDANGHVIPYDPYWKVDFTTLPINPRQGRQNWNDDIDYKDHPLWKYAPVVWMPGLTDRMRDGSSMALVETVEQALEDERIDILVEPLMYPAPPLNRYQFDPLTAGSSRYPFFGNVLDEQTTSFASLPTNETWHRSLTETAWNAVRGHAVFRTGQTQSILGLPNEIRDEVRAIGNLRVPVAIETPDSFKGNAFAHVITVDQADGLVSVRTGANETSYVSTSQLWHGTDPAENRQRLVYWTCMMGWVTGATRGHSLRVNPKGGKNGQDHLILSTVGNNNSLMVWESVDGGKTWTMIQPLYFYSPMRYEVNTDSSFRSLVYPLLAKYTTTGDLVPFAPVYEPRWNVSGTTVVVVPDGISLYVKNHSENVMFGEAHLANHHPLDVDFTNGWLLVGCGTSFASSSRHFNLSPSLVYTYRGNRILFYRLNPIDRFYSGERPRVWRVRHAWNTSLGTGRSTTIGRLRRAERLKIAEEILGSGSDYGFGRFLPISTVSTAGPVHIEGGQTTAHSFTPLGYEWGFRLPYFMVTDSSTRRSVWVSHDELGGTQMDRRLNLQARFAKDTSNCAYIMLLDRQIGHMMLYRVSLDTFHTEPLYALYGVMGPLFMVVEPDTVWLGSDESGILAFEV